MTPSPDTGCASALATPPDPQEQATACRELLRHVCGHLGLPPQDAEGWLDTDVVLLQDIPIAMHLETQAQRLDFYADCGLPRPCDENDLYRHLLEEALSNDLPALSFALHPHSRHIVARGSLHLQATDPEGWLCAGLLLAAVDRIHHLHERFTLAT